MLRGNAMPKDYRLRLEKLSAAPPQRKAPLVRVLLPQIEALLDAGHSLKAIWRALSEEGLGMSYGVFHMTVWRARKGNRPTAAMNREPRLAPVQPSEPKTAAPAPMERDPLANLRLLEENRPGFHWRTTSNPETKPRTGLKGKING